MKLTCTTIHDIQETVYDNLAGCDYLPEHTIDAIAALALEYIEGDAYPEEANLPITDRLYRLGYIDDIDDILPEYAAENAEISTYIFPAILHAMGHLAWSCQHGSIMALANAADAPRYVELLQNEIHLAE